MSPLMPSGVYMEPVPPVVKDSSAFLCCREASLVTWLQSRSSAGLGPPRSWDGGRGRGSTHLEGPLVVHGRVGVGETRREDAVEPAFQDGRQAEPLHGELEGRQAQAPGVPWGSPAAAAAAPCPPRRRPAPTWKMTRSAASSFRCSATMSSLRRPSFHARPVSAP